MDDFSDECQRLKRSRTELLDKQQRSEVAQLPIVGQPQDSAQALEIDVFRSDFVMPWSGPGANLPESSVRLLCGDRQHGLLGGPGGRIDEVPDHAGGLADDSGVRLGDKVANCRGVPVIAARRPTPFVQPLLDYRPVAG